MDSKLDSTDRVIILGLVLDDPEFMALLIQKCHNPEFVIPDDETQIFEAFGFMEKGVVTQSVKRFVLNRLRIRKEDGVIEVKVISNDTKKETPYE